MEGEVREPANVTDAIAAIMGEIGGIAKEKHSDALKYAYRGIEDLTTRIQPLMVKYGVVFYPRGEITSIREIVVNGNPWTDTCVSVEYEVRHGASDTAVIVRVPGIGRDNADKGSNKGMTQAFKYALLQTFMIADPEDDNDGTHDQRDSGTVSRPTSSSEAPSGRSAASEKQVGMIRGKFRDLGLTSREQQTAYVAQVLNGQSFTTLVELSAAQASTVIEQQIADIAKMEAPRD